MNREDIIKMAREAGFNVEQGFLLRLTGVDEDLERFAALVIAEKEKQIIAANAPEIERINAYIKELEKAVVAEREACAKLCEELLPGNGSRTAAAIRARGGK